MADLPYLNDRTLDEIIDAYMPEIRGLMEKLEDRDPEKARKMRNGWQEDLEQLINDALAPLYEKVVQLNPARMRHDLELWEEISAEARAAIEELERIWTREIRDAL